MAAPDEVPPHHQLFAERRAAENHQPSRGVTTIDDAQLVAAGLLVGQVGDVEHGTGDLDAAAVEQHAVFESPVDIQRDRRAGTEVELCAE